MFCNEDEKQQILQKWQHILCDRCEICNGNQYINGSVCKCKLKAVKHTKLEINNLPIKSFKIDKSHIQKINFDFKEYFNNIQNEIYDVQNLYLLNFSNELNIEIIGYIAKSLVATKHNITDNEITIYYEIFENLIQLSLRSNVDKEARNKLNDIIHKPYILFLDSVGTETGFQSQTNHNVKLFNLILKERLNRCKSTIISSNFNLSQMENFYGEDTVRFLQNYKLVRG